ncbi:MAG: hypothetical protein WAV46_03055 [Candidatus Moraniibacteriota bacterium]
MPFITIIIFGALAGCFALLLELAALSIPFVASPSTLPFFAFDTIFSLRTFITLLVLALIEEFSKFLFLIRYRPYAPRNGRNAFPIFILLALLFGIGFSSLEIAFSTQATAAFPVVAIFKILFLHIGTSLLFVYCLFSSPEPDKTFSSRNFRLLSLAVSLHLVYNILLFLTA